MMGAVAEFERALLKERQRVEQKENKSRVAREFGIGRETLYQYLDGKRVEIYNV